MNNKIVINTYVSMIEFKTNKHKANKQNRTRLIDTENILLVARWVGYWGDG